VTKKSDNSNWVLKIVEGEFQPESETKKLNQASWEEVSILAKIQHQNIIRYEDSWSQGTTLMILMEYADGGTLEEQWKAACKAKQPFSEEKVIKWTVQLLLAVEYCHGVHSTPPHCTVNAHY